MFDAGQWQQLLTDTAVRSIDYHDELPSTNDLALRQLDHPAHELPRLVITARQTRGRGRQQNRWWTSDGALTFSLIVDLAQWRLTSDRIPQIALWTGLGIRDALAGCVPHSSVQLKWPNDVFLNGCKVCGILVEGASRSPGRAVVGVGINVNNRLADFGNTAIENCQPPSGVPQERPHASHWTGHATSIVDVTGGPVDLLSVLIEVLRGMTDAWQVWALGSTALPQAWNSHCLLTGRHVVCEGGAAAYEGICQGVDEQGYLLLARAGQVHRCIGGTVTRVEGLR